MLYPQGTMGSLLPFASIHRRSPASAFDDFYRDEFPRLAGSLVIVCGDRGVAEELAQEAFTRALNHWDRVSLLDRPAGWLYRTGFNLLRAYWRRNARDERPLTTDPIVVPQDGSRVDLVRLLGRLSHQQRQAVVLRHVLDYSTDEAAEVMQISAGALRMTLHRAVESLRTYADVDFKEEDDGP